ncbi:energy-coupling factor ABC transporter ATP-binding protein [Corynebacterium mendelii]|uniref:ABC transporter ATP-binding protein n=1 Tax=Corynebacterium mendelii TaxID=2765362 RepID=A0A939IYT6_9CORY|nr:energy-coupling factor ABC transporter ATP-binding protein [Corynebacterium mendelii]MBN9645007.1 energy-coupling factor ABC transporter ATP-binding protein [Corynebacterium mendelii]
MDTHDPLIAACGVDFFHHKDAPILTDVSLGIAAGDTIALLGANGSGKSTLFRLLAGVWQPTAGHIELRGSPYRYTRAGRDAVRRSVQLVLQEPDDQIFAISVQADVAYGPTNQGLDKAEIRARTTRAMIDAEITDLADNVPHQLSYGQRKRVALAGALAMQPAVLLLDEPTAGLDPAGGRQLKKTLQRLSSGGTAVVVSTHDVNLAWEVSTRAAVIVDGRLMLGPTGDILTDTELLRRARLEVPWAPFVSQAVGKTITTPQDLL